MRENRKYGLMRENRTLFYGIPKRARSWKRRLRPRDNLKNDVPVLYSTGRTAPIAREGITIMARTSRNLIVLSDGTGNTASQRRSRPMYGAFIMPSICGRKTGRRVRRFPRWISQPAKRTRRLTLKAQRRCPRGWRNWPARKRTKSSETKC